VAVLLAGTLIRQNLRPEQDLLGKSHQNRGMQAI